MCPSSFVTSSAVVLRLMKDIYSMKHAPDHRLASALRDAGVPKARALGELELDVPPGLRIILQTSEIYCFVFFPRTSTQLLASSAWVKKMKKFASHASMSEKKICRISLQLHRVMNRNGFQTRTGIF
jgi:alanine racemase